MIYWLALSLLCLACGAQAQTSSWRDSLLPEATASCQSLPNFDRLLAYYYSALRADPSDAINLKALRDFSALALRHGEADQAAYLFTAHLAHNDGRPASSAVTKALVNTYLAGGERDALIGLILAPPPMPARTLGELQFMVVVGLAERKEAWIALELARRTPGLFDSIDLDLALYLGAVRAGSPRLIDRSAGQVPLIEVQALEAALKSDFPTYASYADLPEARRIKAIAAFAYGLSLAAEAAAAGPPPFDQVVAPLRAPSDPALVANVFARLGRPSWAVEVLAAANAAPQFAPQVRADVPLANEPLANALVQLGAEAALVDIHRQQFLTAAPGLAVSLMRAGLYEAARQVLSTLSAEEVRDISPLIVLAIIANGDLATVRDTWEDQGLRSHLFDNLGQFEPAFVGSDSSWRALLNTLEQNSALDRQQKDFTFNLLTNLLELDGRFDRSAEALARITAPDVRLRAANSLAQAISHRCFGGMETVSPFYPFTLGDSNLDADYRHRTLRVE